MLLADSLTVYFVQDARSQRDAHYEEDRDPRVPSYPFPFNMLSYVSRQPKRGLRDCIWGTLELVHIARIKAAAKLDEARKTGRNDLADQLVQPTFTR
jgi:hypothetical protein